MTRWACGNLLPPSAGSVRDHRGKIHRQIHRLYLPAPRGSLERSDPRGALRAHHQHYRSDLSGRQSSKTCLKEKGRVALSSRGSAGNPSKVGPIYPKPGGSITRNLALRRLWSVIAARAYERG